MVVRVLALTLSAVLISNSIPLTVVAEEGTSEITESTEEVEVVEDVEQQVEEVEVVEEQIDAVIEEEEQAEEIEAEVQEEVQEEEVIADDTGSSSGDGEGHSGEDVTGESTSTEAVSTESESIQSTGENGSETENSTGTTEENSEGYGSEVTTEVTTENVTIEQTTVEEITSEEETTTEEEETTTEEETITEEETTTEEDTTIEEETTTEVEMIEYEFLEVSEINYIIGSDELIQVRVDADFEKFVDAYVDDELLWDEDYDAWSGSTVVQLNKEFMELLDVGDHELQLEFTDGYAVFEFNIEESEEVIQEREYIDWRSSTSARDLYTWDWMKQLCGKHYMGETLEEVLAMINDGTISDLDSFFNNTAFEGLIEEDLLLIEEEGWELLDIIAEMSSSGKSLSNVVFGIETYLSYESVIVDLHHKTSEVYRIPSIRNDDGSWGRDKAFYCWAVNGHPAFCLDSGLHMSEGTQVDYLEAGFDYTSAAQAYIGDDWSKYPETQIYIWTAGDYDAFLLAYAQFYVSKNNPSMSLNEIAGLTVENSQELADGYAQAEVVYQTIQDSGSVRTHIYHVDGDPSYQRLACVEKNPIIEEDEDVGLGLIKKIGLGIYQSDVCNINQLNLGYVNQWQLFNKGYSDAGYNKDIFNDYVQFMFSAVDDSGNVVMNASTLKNRIQSGMYEMDLEVCSGGAVYTSMPFVIDSKVSVGQFNNHLGQGSFIANAEPKTITEGMLLRGDYYFNSGDYYFDYTAVGSSAMFGTIDASFLYRYKGVLPEETLGVRIKLSDLEGNSVYSDFMTIDSYDHVNTLIMVNDYALDRDSVIVDYAMGGPLAMSSADHGCPVERLSLMYLTGDDIPVNYLRYYAGIYDGTIDANIVVSVNGTKVDTITLDDSSNTYSYSESGTEYAVWQNRTMSGVAVGGGIANNPYMLTNQQLTTSPLTQEQVNTNYSKMNHLATIQTGYFIQWYDNYLNGDTVTIEMELRDELNGLLAKSGVYELDIEYGGLLENNPWNYEGDKTIEFDYYEILRSGKGFNSYNLDYADTSFWYNNYQKYSNYRPWVIEVFDDNDLSNCVGELTAIVDYDGRFDLYKMQTDQTRNVIHWNWQTYFGGTVDSDLVVDSIQAGKQPVVRVKHMFSTSTSTPSVPITNKINGGTFEYCPDGVESIIPIELVNYTDEPIMVSFNEDLTVSYYEGYQSNYVSMSEANKKASELGLTIKLPNLPDLVYMTDIKMTKLSAPDDTNTMIAFWESEEWIPGMGNYVHSNGTTVQSYMPFGGSNTSEDLIAEMNFYHVAFGAKTFYATFNVKHYSSKWASDLILEYDVEVPITFKCIHKNGFNTATESPTLVSMTTTSGYSNGFNKLGDDIYIFKGNALDSSVSTGASASSTFTVYAPQDMQWEMVFGVSHFYNGSSYFDISLNGNVVVDGYQGNGCTNTKYYQIKKSTLNLKKGNNTIKYTWVSNTFKHGAWIYIPKYGAKAATCLEKGYTFDQCSHCYDTENFQTLAALGHDYEKKEAGLYPEMQISEDNKYYYDGNAIPQLFSESSVSGSYSRHFEKSDAAGNYQTVWVIDAKEDTTFDISGKLLNTNYGYLTIYLDSTSQGQWNSYSTTATNFTKTITVPKGKHKVVALFNKYNTYIDPLVELQLECNTIAATCTSDEIAMYGCSRCTAGYRSITPNSMVDHSYVEHTGVYRIEEVKIQNPSSVAQIKYDESHGKVSMDLPYTNAASYKQCGFQARVYCASSGTYSFDFLFNVGDSHNFRTGSSPTKVVTLVNGSSSGGFNGNLTDGMSGTRTMSLNAGYNNITVMLYNSGYSGDTQFAEHVNNAHFEFSLKKATTTATCLEPACKYEYCEFCSLERKTETAPATGHQLTIISSSSGGKYVSTSCTNNSYKALTVEDVGEGWMKFTNPNSASVSHNIYYDVYVDSTGKLEIEKLDFLPYSTSESATFYIDNTSKGSLYMGYNQAPNSKITLTGLSEGQHELRIYLYTPSKDSGFETSVMFRVPPESQNPTCTEAGHGIYHCSVCNRNVYGPDIDATGHDWLEMPNGSADGYHILKTSSNVYDFTQDANGKWVGKPNNSVSGIKVATDMVMVLTKPATFTVNYDCYSGYSTTVGRLTIGGEQIFTHSYGTLTSSKELTLLPGVYPIHAELKRGNNATSSEYLNFWFTGVDFYNGMCSVKSTTTSEGYTLWVCQNDNQHVKFMMLPMVEITSSTLSISTKVKGNLASMFKEFDYSITLTDQSDVPVSGDFIIVDADGNDTGEVLTFDVNGQARVTLKHGEQINISGLEVGTKYSVVSDDYSEEGYVSSLEDDSDLRENITIGIQQDVIVKFLQYNHGVVPSGVDLEVGQWIILTFLSAIMLFMLMSKKRREE